MRTIEIFVSAPRDVQKELALSEQLIRSAAAEFNLPIHVSYSNPLRGSSHEKNSVEHKKSLNESIPTLCPCFCEYPESEENDLPKQGFSPGRYDLVICILWSRLGTILPSQCVMPDRSRPRSATDYQVAWALDQPKRIPGCPGLHIYRNRATPAVPLEPKEQRRNLWGEWDAVQEFFTAWEKNAGTKFRASCHDFPDLEEFENLFRTHFRDFLARRLSPWIVPDKASSNGRSGSNPFRGLDFFDFEDSALYHGRTKAVGEVLDVLEKQVAAEKPFLLVLGPSGSGKSSLVRAGLLPLITRGATPAGTGPWRRALTRPGADPFEALAAALLAKSALPELQDTNSPSESKDLASRLRRDPDEVAARIGKMMDQLTRQELGHLLADRKAGALPAKETEGVEIAGLPRLAQVKPMTQLALVVDQLEELFTQFSPVLQQKYIAALCALANCEPVFVIATLRKDCYPHYQRFSELTAFGGRYDLEPPTPRGIGSMIRFAADAAGLRFERDPETSRSLDETIVKAAVANPEPLPLLQHLLSRLYHRQLARKDGLLLWSDYRALGGFQNALAQHAEFVFLTLKSDEQHALKFVIRNLLTPSCGEENLLNRRSISYRDLISSPQLDQRLSAGAKGLVDRLINEGLLSVKADPQQELMASIPQEALVRRWPRLWQLVSEDRRLLQMQDRLHTSLQVWLSRGCKDKDLLGRGIGLAEAQTLLTDFESQLNPSEIEYCKKSLAKYKPRRNVPHKIGLAAIAGLAIFAAFLGGARFNEENRRTNQAQDFKPSQQDVGLAASQRSELEAERGVLEIRLKEAEQNLEIAQQKAHLADDQRSKLETELKKAREENAQLAEQNSSLAANQRSQVEAQVTNAGEKVQIEQQSADLANSRRSELETELKKAQAENAQLAKQNTNLAASRNGELDAQQSLETQLEEAQKKLQLAQQNADLANSRRSELETQLKNKQAELQQVRADADHTNSQLQEIRPQLKQEPEREQNRQVNTGSSTSEIRGVSPDALTGSKTEVVFQEKQDNLPTGKSTPPQNASPIPLPSPAKESEAVNSAKPQSDQTALTDDKALVKQFVLGYIKSVASDDTSLQRPYFGEQVNYYGEGVIGSPNIEASLERYRTQWPVRDWQPRGEAKVARVNGPNLFAVLQPFNWAVSDGSNQSHGNATLYARVRKTAQGKFQIEYLRQLTGDHTGRQHRRRK